jgi:PASTA domain
MQTLSDSTIQDFAASVRLELRDLPKSVVEELTGDLEASLQERRQDEGEDFQLGSPTEYAAELREAAGMGPRPVSKTRFSSKAALSAVESWLRKYQLTNAILEFGISVKPLWWVLRATLAWGVFSGFFPNSTTDLALLVLFIFLSVQWGRKKWFTGKFFEGILLPLNLVAVLLIAPGSVLISNAVNTALNAQQVMKEWSVDSGLVYNGESVTEIKAYDSAGAEVNGLIFRDQNGNPLEIGVPLEELTQYQVPDVLGFSYENANSALSEAGLPGVDYIWLNDVSEKDAYVVSIEPAAGSAVTSRDVVTVTFDRK